MPARLILVGDHMVGTSSLLRRFNLGLFHEQYKPEIAKVMRHTKNVHHEKHACYVTVQFWDIEGSASDTALQCALKAHAVAVVYDLTNRTSFEKAQQLLDGINPRASTLLIANKLDLRDQRRVSYEEGRLLAKIHRVEYVEASAKQNYNIDEAFNIFVSSVPEEYLLNVDLNATMRWKKATSTALCALCWKKITRHTDERYVFEDENIKLSIQEEEHLRYEKRGHVKYRSAESLSESRGNRLHAPQSFARRSISEQAHFSDPTKRADLPEEFKKELPVRTGSDNIRMTSQSDRYLSSESRSRSRGKPSISGSDEVFMDNISVRSPKRHHSGSTSDKSSERGHSSSGPRKQRSQKRINTELMVDRSSHHSARSMYSSDRITTDNIPKNERIPEEVSLRRNARGSQRHTSDIAKRSGSVSRYSNRNHSGDLPKERLRRTYSDDKTEQRKIRIKGHSDDI